MIVAPPGTGKTVIAAALIASWACSTLILVHRRPLLEQWVARLGQFLGLESDVIGTSIIGEGFDDPRLDTLVLAVPTAWKGTVTQYAGRLHRHHDAKDEIRIIDYVDQAVPVLRRMFAKRQRAYASRCRAQRLEMLFKQRLSALPYGSIRRIAP